LALSHNFCFIARSTAITSQKHNNISGKTILVYGHTQLECADGVFQTRTEGGSALTSLVVLAETLGVFMTGTGNAGGRMLPSGNL
jgi:hypothetical protein